MKNILKNIFQLKRFAQTNRSSDPTKPDIGTSTSKRFLSRVLVVGMCVVMALLAYEHSIISPRNLSRMNAAFFTLNGIISVVFFVSVAADVLHRR